QIIERRERRKKLLEGWTALREDHDAAIIDGWGDTPDLTILLDPFASVVVHDFANKFFALNHLLPFGYWCNTRQRSFYITAETLADNLEHVAAGIRTIITGQIPNETGDVQYGILCPDTESDDWYLFVGSVTHQSRVVKIRVERELESHSFGNIEDALHISALIYPELFGPHQQRVMIPA
ncbi:hypothetical protein, partial [Xenorhabdus bovienii]|uniref:hypothetical protein n=1 Tax=Xenorhabdus bovienii TaxID=40576 RepID=UPI003DA57B97